MDQQGRQYNAAGSTGRDCPICFRPGTLTGARTVGATLECHGCFRQFRFDGGGDDVFPHTLTRIDTSSAPRKRCDCGALVGLQHDRCNPCAANDAVEAQAAGR